MSSHASYSLVQIVALIMNILVHGLNRDKQLCFGLLIGKQHYQYKSGGLFGQFNQIQYLSYCQAQRQAKMHVEPSDFTNCIHIVQPDLLLQQG